MSFVKQLAGETVIYGISSILSRVVYFIFLTGYLTRLFSSDRTLYGIHQDLYAYMALLLIFFTYRMETAYFRLGSKPENEARVFSTAFVSILFSTIFFASIMLVFRHTLAELLEYPGKGIYIIYMLLIIGFDALAAIPFARLRLQNRPLKFAFIKVINVVLTVFFVVFFLEICPWLIDQGYTSLSHIYQERYQLDLVIIANVLSSGIVLLLLAPQITYEASFDMTLLKSMLWYVLPLIVVSLAGVFNQSFAVPLLSYWLPDSKAENLQLAAIYAAAAKLALLMNLFTQAFNYAAEPFFFKKANDKNAKETYADIAQAFSLAASIGLLGIALYLDVFKYLLDENYRDGLFVVPILLIAYWFLGLYYNFSIWYKIEDKTYIGAIISIGGAVVTLVTAALLIPKYGMVAMAWAALFCYAFMAISSFLTGRRHYPVQYPVGKMIQYLLLAFLVYLVYNFTLSYYTMSGWIQFIFSTVLLSIYLAAILWIDYQKIRTWLGRP